MTAVIRSADERRNASSMMSNSIKCSSVGGHVGWTINTSPPRTFSSIWKLNSPSEKRSGYARPMSQLSWRQISSANLGFAFPEKIFMPPVVPIVLALETNKEVSKGLIVCHFKYWLGRVDSNQRMPVPKTGALPLGYAPVSGCELRERKSG